MLGGEICRWLLLFQEYDFEVIVKPGRLNVGPDHLSRIEIGEEPTNLEEGLPDAQLFAVHIVDSHIEDIIHVLTTGTVPKGYTSQQKKELVVRMVDFSIIGGHLYKMGSNEILRRYVLDFEQSCILTEAHGGAARGHYAGKEIVRKVLHAGLWSPTLHKDAKAYCRAYDACKITGRPSRRDELPLIPHVMLQPFEKWVIDFVGPI